MKADKLSVSFDHQLARRIRAAADRESTSLSSWLAEAAAAKLRTGALAEFVAEWEAESGPLTATEIAQAEYDLRVGPASTAA